MASSDQIKLYIIRNKKPLLGIGIFHFIIILLWIIMAIQVSGEDGTGLIAITILSIIAAIIFFLTLVVQKISRKEYLDLIPLTILTIIPILLLCLFSGLI